ncbi:hypothetical protein BGZ74_006959 [Mortierella antarctica]|nr:hypothetical protein BGZ74_006959 [Mortierella antarctica]
MKIAAILSTLAAATLVSAGKFHPLTNPETRYIPGGFIIEFQEDIPRNVAHNALNSKKVDYKVRNDYTIFNGAAISVNSKHDGNDIAKISGVKNVWPITLHSIPRVQASKKKTTDPETASLHQMTGVDLVHKKYKLTGKGIKVGIIDTGVDYKHPAFAAKGAKDGCFARHGKNCRVAHGWDFVGDKYDGKNKPEPDSDPMDCQGHGTHVAGIVGGDALNIKTTPKPPQPFVGVAPEVTFGAYRIFGCDGSSGDDVIMAAMEMAFSDGMDIINMSLGGGSSYKSNPQAVLGDQLVAKGMVLAAAAGNDGSEGVWMVSDTGLGDLATSVASFDNLYGMYHSFSYGGVAHPYSPAETWGKPINVANGTLLPLFEKDGTLSDGCDATLYSGVDVKGKTVLVLGDFTRCKSGARGENAQKAGAAALLVQSTPYGLAGLGGFPGFPVASIEFKAGEEAVAVYKKAPKTPVTFSKDGSNFLVEGGGAPSDFSSFGLDGDLRSKPDLSAPGGNILSTVPLAHGGYELMSGTSMATPYVAGAHALYMQAKKSKPRGDVIRGVFKNTATIATNFGSKTKASAAKQGAGLINVLRAITTTTSISPDHIDLLDTKNFRKSIKVTLKNNGKRAETYTLSHVPADALNSYPDPKKSWPLGTPLIEADYATVAFSQSKVKIPAGKSVKVTLNFKEPKAGKATAFPLYSGYVIATPSSKGGVAVSVPYTGIKGDISRVPIMDTDTGFPTMGYLNSTHDFNEIPKGFTFDLKKDTPVVLTRLASHTPDRQIRIYDANKKFAGFLFSGNNGAAFGKRGRDTNLDQEGNMIFDLWSWKGQVVATANVTAVPSTLPAGTYSVVVASQRKFTKGVYPADFEVFDLGSIKF